jgi:hypothetical protein
MRGRKESPKGKRKRKDFQKMNEKNKPLNLIERKFKNFFPYPNLNKRIKKKRNND